MYKITILHHVLFGGTDNDNGMAEEYKARTISHFFSIFVEK